MKAASDQAVARPRGPASSHQAMRQLPIRWRILSLAALNALVVFVFATAVWDGTRILTDARNELQQTRDSERLLARVEGDAVRLQGLIHRYFTQPNADLLKEITRLRETVLTTLKVHAAADPMLKVEAEPLRQATDRFVAGFSDLRNVQSAISTAYESQVLKAVHEMAGLYAIMENGTREQSSLIWPSLSKSRESFSTTLVLTNALYLTQRRNIAEEILKNLDAIEATIPVMLDLADNDLQRGALGALAYRIVSWRLGVANLTEHFTTRSQLLREEIDGNQQMIARTIDKLSDEMRNRERVAYNRFENALSNMYLRIAIASVLTLFIAVLIGLAIARSIVGPLRSLMTAMHAIVAGHYGQTVRDTDARDEIGEMARAVEVFRENAIAKRQAEIELKSAKENAESALRELQETQRSLIEAEKLAALGGLVAGVAHEVNNPVGISLTVASSFARRCDQFSTEVRDGAVRKSRLDEFISGSQEAAKQLVANLNRAADLIQAFKQVAVDRSHAERRVFELGEATEQIVASLLPALKRSAISFSVDIGEEITMDSYPGPYGQVLTNLALNALAHAFPDRRAGSMRLAIRRDGPNHVQIEFADDGIGMNEETQRRAFEPFFTTRRSHGGTGLGLHIVFNIVTRRLGGRLRLDSALGRGTTLWIRLPLTAPREEPAEPPQIATLTLVPPI
ncbi:MAG: HAMP domain-containing protein [Rhizobiales bacterium]|nr:HAMP domain-containing protein [Hyphomicrobiales bacterium]